MGEIKNRSTAEPVPTMVCFGLVTGGGGGSRRGGGQSAVIVKSLNKCIKFDEFSLNSRHLSCEWEHPIGEVVLEFTIFSKNLTSDLYLWVKVDEI